MKHPKVTTVAMAVLVLGLFAGGVLSASGATAAYTVTGATTTANWVDDNNSTSPANIATALSSDDTNTSYARTTTANAPLQMQMSNPGGDLGTITDVTVNYSVRNRTGGAAGNITVQLGVDLGGVKQWKTAQTLASSTAYSTLSYTAVPRPGGGSWTWADIQNLETLTQATVIDGTTYMYRVSYVEVVVTYTAYTATTVVLANGTTVPAGYATPGQTGVVVDAFTLDRTDGNKNAVVNTVTVTGSGTPGNVVSGVSIYRDENADGLLDAGDTMLNAAPVAFSGTTATITISEPVDNTLRQYLVVYDFSGTAANNATISANVTAATRTNVDTFTRTTTVGNTFTVDAGDPAATISAPTAGQVLIGNAGANTTLSGNATDGVSGVSAVQITLQRLDTNEYWNGTTWQTGIAWLSTTLSAPNTTNTNWSTTWALPTQNATFDYQLIARATDRAGRSGSSTARTFRVDTVRPAISSAVANDSTHVTVNWTDALNATTVAAGDFTITGGAGLTVSAVTVIDADTIQLTTSAQVPGTSYTVNCAATRVADPHGNTNNATTGTFTGFAAPALTAAAGPNRPAAAVYLKPGDTNKVVDQIRFSATNGAVTVSTIQVIGLDTANALRTDIGNVRLYVDNGDGVFDSGVDAQLGTTQTGSTFTSNTSGTGYVTFSGLTMSAPAGGSTDVWVVYDIAAGATSGRRVGSRLTNANVVVTAPATVTAFTQIDSVAAGQTLIIDAVVPAVAVTAPAASTTLSGVAGSAYTFTGTSSDALAGVSGVEVSITDGTQYWDGSAWTLTPTWLSTTDTSGAGSWATWSRAWVLPSDAGTTVYTVNARATDRPGNQATATRTFNVDNVKPSMLSVATVDATHTDVTFSEALSSGTVSAADFTISGGAGLSVSGVSFPNASTVRLTFLTPQIVNTYYTVACAAGVLTDSAGNTNIAGSIQFASFGSASDFTPPTAPGTPTVTAGAKSPTIANLSWAPSTDNVGVTGYRVWRSTDAAGPFAEIGTTAATTFADVTGIVGQAYYYRITAYDALANESGPSGVRGPVTATWSPAPHDVYTASTKLCDLCHIPHQAASTTPILKPVGAATNELDVCYVCHDGSGSSTNIAGGAGDTFAGTLRSGHRVEATSSAAAGDLTNVCSDCHTPHGDWVANSRLPAAEVNGQIAGVKGNAWCLKCHDDAASWYKPGGYGSLISNPTRDATGYPTIGTFPGATTYRTSSRNAHSQIPAGADRQAGDCLYCHTAHRSANPYDGVVATFTSSAAVAKDQTDGDFAALCFTCHSGGAWETSGAANVKQFVTGGTQRSGHRIKTAGGKYGVGAPLPCYECHNPHGSSRGNAFMLSDALGGSLDPTSTAPAGVRAFCFTCHTTADSAKGWDSTAATYTVAVATGKSVAGLPRDAALGANVLRLANVSGHRSTDSQSCYLCHGSSYASGGNNVHSPSGGVSTGGSTCYGCHTVYKDPMERTGTDRTSFYHHVLGSVTTSGDVAPNAGAYATSSTDVLCVSCHTDHNYFNASQSGNLRRNAKVTSGASPVDTDYLTTSADKYGVCISCHEVSLVKEVTGLQKSDGTGETDTPKIVGGTGSGGYGASAHSYAATSTYGDSTVFKADCSKCHDDEQDTEFQKEPGNAFGTHWSNSQRLLSALGGSQVDYLSEDFCYRCHSSVFNPNAGSAKDKYGVRAMPTAGTLEVYEQFTISGGSKHPVVPNGGSTVACENCHNPHVVSATDKITDPATGYAVDAYTTVADKAEFCLTCHDGTLPVRDVSATVYVPVSVTIDGARTAQANKATNAARAHWTANGSISGTEVQSCATCHDNHGSSASKLLGAYDPATDSNKITGTQQTVTITANNNTVCYACHRDASASYTSGYVRDSAGYPTERTYPGQTVFENATYGIHRNVTGGGESTGSCNNCHDVHGTANTFDEVKGTFGASNFGACFACHDGSVAGATNIKQFFPTTVGGSATQSGALPAGTRFGHRVRSNVAGAALAQDEAVPCYDCHNPHGSGSMSGLYVVAATGYSAPSVTYTVIGDNEVLDTSSATGVRRFCFTCHTTFDQDATTPAAQGWNGSAMADVPSGAAFEGIDRVNAAYKLRLPAALGHNLADTKSCYDCHGSNYGTNGSNVHNPTGGVSSGGQDCYGCHTGYTVMDDQVGTYKGSLTTYHHVLGSSTTIEGDEADQFWQSNYPAAGTNVYCLSCHVDHDKFNANKGSNLRGDMTANPAAANSDYNATNGGVCLGCHSVTRAKDTAGQAAGGSTTATGIASATYNASAHQYPVGSTFSGASAFSADCVKCHNDEQTKDYQTSTYEFGIHWSAENRLLKALGAANAGTSSQTEENLCYKCHTGATAGTDGYATASMTAAARSLQTVFGKTRKHNVAGYAGVHVAGEITYNTRHIECEDCHGVHASSVGLHAAKNTSTGSIAGAATHGAVGVRPTTWGANWVASSSTLTDWTKVTMAGGSDDLEGYICLKCHSNYGSMLSGVVPPSGLHSTTNSFTDLAREFNPNNQSYHAVFGASKADSQAYASYVNGWAWNSRMTCSDCHTQEGTTASGPHGSANNWILKWAYNPATEGGSTNTFCVNCHDPEHNTASATAGGTGLATSSGTNLHSSKHGSEPCTECHVTPPHGWQQPHLLNDATHTQMPYTYYINSIGGNDYVVTTWRTYRQWSENSCQHSPCN